jgi:hypothetical protein
MATGREKIHAALSSGAAEIPAVICYEGIFYRDHWQQITSCPWWYTLETDIEKQLQWRREAFNRIDQDWFCLPLGYSKDDGRNYRIETKPDGVYRVDKRNKRAEKLQEPRIGGELIPIRGHNTPLETFAAIDQLITINPEYDPAIIKKDGKCDLADRLLHGIGADLCPMIHISSPLWSCALLWGFERFMMLLVDNPALVKYACERLSALCGRSVSEAATLGAQVIWIEECFTDMIGVEDFKEQNVPYMTRLVELIRDAGMKSIYYYCGDPARKLDLILSVGADAISLEDSKKNFMIEIDDVVEAVQGRCAVLGNLDATHFLPMCTDDELKTEVSRQIKAGRRNNNRFIMSIGSPVTPATSVEKVRLYCDLVHELGKT